MMISSKTICNKNSQLMQQIMFSMLFVSLSLYCQDIEGLKSKATEIREILLSFAPILGGVMGIASGLWMMFSESGKEVAKRVLMAAILIGVIGPVIGFFIPQS